MRTQHYEWAKDDMKLFVRIQHIFSLAQKAQKSFLGIPKFENSVFKTFPRDLCSCGVDNNSDGKKHLPDCKILGPNLICGDLEVWLPSSRTQWKMFGNKEQPSFEELDRIYLECYESVLPTLRILYPPI